MTGDKFIDTWYGKKNPVVTICTTRFDVTALYVQPSQCNLCVFVWISEQTAIISLYNINWLVFVTKTECVYCVVRTECLNIIQINLVFKGNPHGIDNLVWGFTKYHKTNKCTNCMSFILNRFFKTLFTAPTCFDSISLIIIREQIYFLAKITC